MYISQINNNQNITSKAKISLIADKNLLQKKATKQIIEKVKTIGDPNDTIHISITKECTAKSCATTLKMLYNNVKENFPSNFKMHTVIGSHRERQKKAFYSINEYLDNLKKE